MTPETIATIIRATRDAHDALIVAQTAWVRNGIGSDTEREAMQRSIIALRREAGFLSDRLAAALKCGTFDNANICIGDDL